MPLSTLQSHVDDVMEAYTCAESAPRLTCSRCRQQTVLDLPWLRDTKPLCDTCFDTATSKTHTDNYAARQRESGLPSGYYTARFSDFRSHPDQQYAKHQQAVAKKVWESLGSVGADGNPPAPGNTKGCLLLGPTGSGKTHLLAAAANKVLTEQGIKWLDLTELQNELARSVFQKEKEHVEPFGKRLVREFDAVFIDDFTFDSKSYDWLIVAIQQFINDLTAQGTHIRVFMTSNNPLAGKGFKDPVTNKPDRDENIPSLEDIFRGRTVSRLLQLMHPIYLTGPNRRI